MKKILSMILCLMLAMFMLVSCGEDIIGEYLEEYEKPEVKEKLNYNLYIICEDGTSDNAKKTVQQRIADYTGSSEMQTTVNVVYCSASEYNSIVLNKKLDGTKDQADILLVNSESLMDQLVADERLADITEYLNGEYEYAKFNAQIANSLMQASLFTAADGTKVNYCVPNNYVVGHYTYITIDIKNAALYNYSELDLQQKQAGFIGTEYFWLLLAKEAKENNTAFEPDKYINEFVSNIADSSLLLAKYECLSETEPNEKDSNYTYLFFSPDAAEKHGVNLEEARNVKDIAKARELFLNNEGSKLTQSKFDEIFKEVKSAVKYTDEDYELISSDPTFYFNQIIQKNEEDPEAAPVYTYVCFDKEKADKFGLNNNNYFKNCVPTDENDVICLWNAMINAGESDPYKFIKIEEGSFTDKAKYEANGLICNIPALPSATRADAFTGAFAINAKVADVERAMEVIYAINNDDTLHNYLQYGIAETNYDVIDKDDRLIKLSTEETGKYYMNPRYTGDIFGLLYCEELGWTEDKVAPSKMQNDASVFRP
ncbi:MAG: hypothetical protein IJD79_09145 [Clostridia bacterium]|nr:hypothetical protein [Clostridia bacterium]